MSPESAPPRPITLVELLDAASLEQVLKSFAEFHGVGLALVDLEGRVVLSAGGVAPLCEVVRGGAQGAERCAARIRAVHGAEAPGPTGHDCFTGQRYQTWPLAAQETRLGCLFLGPYWPVERPTTLTSAVIASVPGGTIARAQAAAAESTVLADTRARRIVEQVGRMVGLLLEGAHARHVSAQLHLAAMERAYAELEDKNHRLGELVERLREADRMKSSFLATVSHELRTPLTSIIGYSEMLLEGLAGSLATEQREYVSTILEKGDQLLQLISAILDVSRIEAGTMRLASEPVDINEVVRAVLASVEPLARRKQLALSPPPATAAPRVRGDRDKIRQILVNLLSNAIKFTPEGGRIDLELGLGTLHREIGDGSLAVGSSVPHAPPSPVGVRVIVRDNGIGIPKAEQGRIFEPFFQVDSSSTRAYGGTGLGLTLVKSFVEAQGGRVWVESEPGVGSCFTVTLPTAEAMPGPAPEPTPATGASPAAPSAPRRRVS